MTAFYPLGFLGGSAGGWEIMLLFVVILLLYGPERLPGIARSIGKTLEGLRRASHEFKDQIMRLDEDDDYPVVDLPEDEVSEDDVEEGAGEDDVEDKAEGGPPES